MISTAVQRPLAVGGPRARSAFWRYALPASVLSPCLLSVAFPKSSIGWLAFVALVPLFLAWAKASWKQAFWAGWLAGTITFALLFRWMTNSLGDFVGGWSWVALLLMSVIEGLSLAAVAVLTALVCRGRFRASAIFAVPAAWFLIEIVRTRGSLGVPFGELGSVAAHVRWLLPLAAYAGVYGLTALVGLVNGALAGVIGGTPAARRAGSIALLAVTLLIAAGNVARARVTFATPNTTVAVAQGNISQRVKWSPQVFAHTIATYAALTRQAASRGAQVVVWPETAITSFPLQSPELLASLESLAQESGVWIIAGTIDRPTNMGYYNAMLELTPNGRVGGVYYKRWLVPFAEYLPWDKYLRGLPLMDNVSRFIPGPGPHLLSAAQLQWGLLVCYESAFAPYARATVNAGADALIVATDDAWFGTSSGPYQHADAARLDAVQTGRWIVRGADTGISQIIDPKGRIVQSLDLDRQAIIVAQIGPGIATPYDRFGVSWLMALAFIALVAGLGVRRSTVLGWRSRRGRY